MRALVFLLALLPLLGVSQQTPTDTMAVPYFGGMDLRDGVYLSPASFRANRPDVPLADLRDDQGLPVLDIRTVVSKLYWQADTGGTKALRMNAMWGFCQNDVVYIQAGNGFYRIGLMGSLAHMVYQQSYIDWDPYFYGSVSRTVLVQQMVDIERGAVLPFNATGMLQALQADPILLEEFQNLPKKHRNSTEVLFRFLRTYNQRHPLYFVP